MTAEYHAVSGVTKRTLPKSTIHMLPDIYITIKQIL